MHRSKLVCIVCWLAVSCAVLQDAVGQEVGSVRLAPDVSLPAMEFETLSLEKPPTAVVSSLTSSDLSVGDFRVEPYGYLWANALFATERTFPGPFTLWVFSRDQQGESAFELDARRTRAGLNIDGPDLPQAWGSLKSSGRIEIDFLGQFVTENASGARLRHAYWQAENEKWQFLAGQTWDVISPLWPNTINFSVGWAGGNIGFRRTQFRIQRTMNLRNDGQLVVQASLNQDIVPDFPSEPGIRRESADYPVIMTRVAYLFPNAGSPHGSHIGFSGHLGETGFDFNQAGPPPLNLPPQDDVRFKTWSVNLDSQLALTESILLRGELFHGANLSPFLGGIAQGVCPCVRRSIHSTGGWLEFATIWSPQTETHFGSGIDDPANGDFQIGRGMNQFIFANQIWHLTDAITTGLEFTWWRTAYQEQRAGLIPPDQLGPVNSGESYVTEWMVRYEF